MFITLPLCIIMYLRKKIKRMIYMDKKFERRGYVFHDVDDLVEYLFLKFGKLSPLKLQKGLYFLYAYYGATYGKAKQTPGESEQDIAYPPRLFNEEFEAWTFGPVIRSVYNKNRRDDYGNNFNADVIEHIAKETPDVLLFIDELFAQINSVSDFTLVDRSHEDDAWKVAISKGNSTPIDNDDLIQEYARKYA